MKPIIAMYIPILAGALLLSACQQQKQTGADVDPAFKTVTAVEHDNFLRYDSIPPDAPPATKQTGIVVPDVRIARLPQGFSAGDFRANGRVTASGENQLVFTSEKQEMVALQMDALERMSPGMKGLKDQSASLAMRYRSSPAAADEQLQLNLENQMALAYIWQTSEKPLALQDGNRPLLRQQTMKEIPDGNALMNVPVQLVTDSGTVEVLPGEPISFKKDGRNYRVFVQTSAYLAQADPGDDGPSGYVLHATVVQE